MGQFFLWLVSMGQTEPPYPCLSAPSWGITRDTEVGCRHPCSAGWPLHCTHRHKSTLGCKMEGISIVDIVVLGPAGRRR